MKVIEVMKRLQELTDENKELLEADFFIFDGREWPIHLDYNPELIRSGFYDGDSLWFDNEKEDFDGYNKEYYDNELEWEINTIILPVDSGR